MSQEIPELNGANDPNAVEEIAQKREAELRKVEEEAQKKLEKRLKIAGSEEIAEDETNKTEVA